MRNVEVCIRSLKVRNSDILSTFRGGLIVYQDLCVARGCDFQGNIRVFILKSQGKHYFNSDSGVEIEREKEKKEKTIPFCSPSEKIFSQLALCW